MQPISLMNSRGITSNMAQSPATMLPPVVTNRMAPVLPHGLHDNRTIQFVPQQERRVEHYARRLDPSGFPGGLPPRSELRYAEMLSPGYIAVPLAHVDEQPDPLETWGRLGYGTTMAHSAAKGAIGLGLATLFGESWTEHKGTQWYMSPVLWGLTSGIIELMYRIGQRREYERNHQ